MIPLCLARLLREQCFHAVNKHPRNPVEDKGTKPHTDMRLKDSVPMFQQPLSGSRAEEGCDNKMRLEAAGMTLLHSFWDPYYLQSEKVKYGLSRVFRPKTCCRDNP